LRENLPSPSRYYPRSLTSSLMDVSANRAAPLPPPLCSRLLSTPPRSLFLFRIPLKSNFPWMRALRTFFKVFLPLLPQSFRSFAFLWNEVMPTSVPLPTEAPRENLGFWAFFFCVFQAQKQGSVISFCWGRVVCAFQNGVLVCGR